MEESYLLVGSRFESYEKSSNAPLHWLDFYSGKLLPINFSLSRSWFFSERSTKWRKYHGARSAFLRMIFWRTLFAFALKQQLKEGGCWAEKRRTRILSNLEQSLMSSFWLFSRRAVVGFPDVFFELRWNGICRKKTDFCHQSWKYGPYLQILESKYGVFRLWCSPAQRLFGCFLAWPLDLSLSRCLQGTMQRGYRWG